MKRIASVGIILILVGLISACSAQALSVSDVWARPGTADNNSAVYFVIDNPTAADDVLLSASATVAQAVELHESMMDGDVMKMVPQENVPVPAREQVQFKQGGLHVMLIGLTQDLNPGDHFTVNLNFENAGEMALDVEVREP
ncbi:MAG: copper chaperone PCu(A)C [Anaerolineales bacterium]|nr:copper chaperone PCu(A)C [Anaerolineales bacterium]